MNGIGMSKKILLFVSILFLAIGVFNIKAFAADPPTSFELDGVTFNADDCVNHWTRNGTDYYSFYLNDSTILIEVVCEGDCYGWQGRNMADIKSDFASKGYTLSDDFGIILVYNSGITTLDYADKGMGNITRLILPDTLEGIYEQSCYDMPNLQELTIPDSVTYIEGGAFKYCNSLTKIYGGRNIETLDEGAFMVLSGPLETTLYGVGDALLNYNWAGDNREVTILPPPEPESVPVSGNRTYTTDGTGSVPIKLQVDSTYKITLPAAIGLTRITESGADQNKASASYVASCTGLITNNEKVFLTADPNDDCAITDGVASITVTAIQGRSDWHNGDASDVSAKISTDGTEGADYQINGTVKTDAPIVHAGNYSGTLKFAFGKTDKNTNPIETP